MKRLTESDLAELRKKFAEAMVKKDLMIMALCFSTLYVQAEHQVLKVVA